MRSERIMPDDSRVQSAVAELKGIIGRQYPQATFEVSVDEDPEGVYLTTTVDTDDLTTVLDLVVDRLVDMQVEEGLPLYLVPVRPLQRVLAEMTKRPARSRTRLGLREEPVPTAPGQGAI